MLGIEQNAEDEVPEELRSFYMKTQLVFDQAQTNFLINCEHRTKRSIQEKTDIENGGFCSVFDICDVIVEAINSDEEAKKSCIPRMQPIFPEGNG